ncbi:MAG: mechanosensitive ion channel, partial [Gammaproteobacteria bacterium]|nr:mechanosensitive ion channel [Gammaproteobacteria bacterium]
MRDKWESLLGALPQIAIALVVFIIVALIGQAVSRAIFALLQRGNFADTHRDFFRRLVAWLFYLAGFTLALGVLGFSGVAASILTGGGVTAVVLGFAFREIGENFLAGFFLAFNRPFNHGDLIQSGDLEGVVRGITLRSTHIRTADGKDVFIPSSQIFKNPLVNYTIDGLRRFRFIVGVDYGDDPVAAADLLRQTIGQFDKVLDEPPPYAGVANLGAAYVEIEGQYWIDTFDSSIK